MSGPAAWQASIRRSSQDHAMPSVLQLCRCLSAPPECPPLPRIQVRHFAGDADIGPWLDVRHQAFARQRIGVRQWSHHDFLDEFVRRWWWRPDHMWMAEAPATQSALSAQPKLVGSVTLAMRGRPDDARPVVHWLMVLPPYRRRGIGRLLMAHLERAAWNTGQRKIYLETHAAWTAATKFYEALGYAPEQE